MLAYALRSCGQRNLYIKPLKDIFSRIPSIAVQGNSRHSTNCMICVHHFAAVNSMSLRIVSIFQRDAQSLGPDCLAPVEEAMNHVPSIG